ncbi:MAG TPA: hypothetical protein VFG23_03365 [Polyangia bacterium]|nr:hypothetical protein [Polyangia bacterium]
MAMGCDDVGARMMELLYGELPEGERAAIQAHLDRDAGGCERCRSELADLQRVRVHARQGLDDAPPAHAHAAILRAAEAATARARVVPTATPSRRASRWDRLRSRWTFPTLATIGAVAVFLLANKIFLEPERTYQRGLQGLAPAETQAPVAEPPAAQAPPTPARAADRPAPSVARETAATEPAAPPAPSALGGRGKSGSLRGAGIGTDDLQMGAPPAPHRRAIPARSQDQAAKREASDGEDGLVHPAMRAEPAANDDELGRSFAPPPPPRIAQPASAAYGAPAKKSVADEALEGLDDRGSGSGAPAATTASNAQAKAAPREQSEKDSPSPRASAPPPANAPRARQAESVNEEDERALDDRDAAPRREKDRRDAAPVARADHLFEAGRWVEAANAYRELLRRDPHNPDAARWRKRLAAAQAAMDR